MKRSSEFCYLIAPVMISLRNEELSYMENATKKAIDR